MDTVTQKEKILLLSATEQDIFICVGVGTEISLSHKTWKQHKANLTDSVLQTTNTEYNLSTWDGINHEEMLLLTAGLGLIEDLFRDNETILPPRPGGAAEQPVIDGEERKLSVAVLLQNFCC